MNTRWKLIPGRKAIEWIVDGADSHMEDIEMAGFGCSDVVKYGAENGFLVRSHNLVFPTLRIHPNDTFGNWKRPVTAEELPRFLYDGNEIAEKLLRVEFDGILHLECQSEDGSLRIVHTCWPSPSFLACYEQLEITNLSSRPVILVPAETKPEIDHILGPMGVNILEVSSDIRKKTLASGESCSYTLTLTGRVAGSPRQFGDPQRELKGRRERFDSLTSSLKLDTGNDILDTFYTFAQFRAGESVFQTRCGLIHSPGGYSYYAAVWCNDEVEYSGPWFSYTGDEKLKEAAYNAYRLYMPYMSDHYEPIPSSIIAEGLDFWNGAGDRGDAAMYLYGASRFALVCGDKKLAEKLLPAIEWCAEYCDRKKSPEGVILSDSDELEGRFPAGEANLCTSCLTYSGYLAAAALEKEIGTTDLAAAYVLRAKELRWAINRYFAADLHDFDTYAYYKGCENLRSWICMPLCVGLTERAEGTVGALTSEFLMTDEGMLTDESNSTIWDRSTLYALRGIFAAGYSEKATELLLHYAENRLLKERVPYPVEAYPEGGKRHLSGESSLFCKVILEGILDVEPTGMRSFTFTPRLPDGFGHLYLENIRAFGHEFSIRVTPDSWEVTETGNSEPLKQGDRESVGIKTYIEFDR